jgi:hypothetical protein
MSERYNDLHSSYFSLSLVATLQSPSKISSIDGPLLKGKAVCVQASKMLRQSTHECDKVVNPMHRPPISLETVSGGV